MRMIEVEPVNSLDWKHLRQICASPGPCITMLLSAHHPGGQSLPYSVRLKAASRSAEQKLLEFCPPGQVEELLAPIYDLAEEPQMAAGGEDMVLCRAPGVFSRFQAPASVKETVVVGAHFYVIPLIGMLAEEQEFYILGIGQKGLRLLFYRGGKCQEVPIPASIPGSLEAAGGFDQPDHVLENRSSAGKSAGAGGGVYFGTGSERETTGERLQYFFRLVDKGLHKILRGRPLLLSGAEYETAMYRRAATYSRIAAGDLAGDLRLFPLEKIQRLSAQYARRIARERAEAALQEFYERPERVASDLAAIAAAAGGGRVAKLILAEDAASSTDDLVNTAAVRTIRNGGEVLLLPADQMADRGPAVALLRY